MKLFPKLPFCLIFSIVFVAFLSCKKVDFYQNNIFVDESKFFSVPANADPIIGRVISELKMQKDRNPNLIESIVKRNGYPIWDKAQITKQDNAYQSLVSGEDTIIYIPLAVHGEEKVTAFFLATVNNYIELQLYNKFDYEEFGFDTTGMSNANRLALQFMILDFVTFGHKSFVIHDNRLLKDFQIALDAPIKDRTVHIDYYNDSVYGRGWEIREFYVCTSSTYLQCRTPGVCCSDGSCSLCHNSGCWRPKVDCEKVASLIYYDAGDPPSGGNSGGGGGGGGGSLPGSSSNVELCNPTPLIQNGLPPCPKGTSLGWEPLELIGPCTRLQNIVNYNSGDNIFNNYIRTLKELAENPSTNIEKARSFQLDQNGNISGFQDFVSNPDEHRMKLTIHNAIDGFVHNHYGNDSYKSFSAGDLYSLFRLFVTNKINNNATFTFTVVTPTTKYLLMIDDPQKFAEFSNRWSPGVNPTAEETLLYFVLRDVYLYHENTSAADVEPRLLSFFGPNSGLSLFRGSSSSNDWTPISINDSGDVIVLPCN